MNQMNFHLVCCLSLVVMFGKKSEIEALPANDYQGYYEVPRDAIVYDYDYYQPYSAPLTDTHLRRLRRGYYFVDDGYITAVPESSVPKGQRRQDSAAKGDIGNGQYTPLVKVRHTRTKHKKLFVPNLYG